MPPGSCACPLLVLTFLAAGGCAFHLPSPPLTSSYTRSYLGGPSVARSQVLRSGFTRSRIVRSQATRSAVVPTITGRRAILSALSGSACPHATPQRVLRRFGNVYVAIPWCPEPDPRSIHAEDARERALEEQLRRHDPQLRESEPPPPVSAPPPKPRHEAIIYPLGATPAEESHEDPTTREPEGPRVYRVPAASGSR